MDTKKSGQNIPAEFGDANPLREAPSVPPWLFQHDNLINALESSRTIEKEKLANTLNYIHFKGGYLYALMQHPKYDKPILVKVLPEICEEHELTCHWHEHYSDFGLENYHFRYLIITESQTIILVPAELLHISNQGIKIQIPQKSHILCKRQTHRFYCSNVNAELMQSGFLAKGKLIDFSSLAFRINVNPEAPFSFHRFDSSVYSTIRLSQNGRTLFSGRCNCVRMKQEFHGWEIVFSPSNDHVKQLQPKRIRHPRLQIYPPPIATFSHPFTQKKNKYEIFNISTTGFSLHDAVGESTLIPGMIIHELSIVYAGELKINCSAQVVQCRKKNDETVIYGIAVLDMDIHSYSRLNRILSMNMDPHNYISTEVDIDALWEFFFDTGFIYPKKYKFFQQHKEEFKKTYKKLYEQTPEIARHFTYEKRGQIYGHMSMIRAYERTWMIHHHAARPMKSKLPGFQILKHMMLFLYGMYHLPSAKMDYVLSYFRPENDFPNRVFGGFARELNDPKICSLDLFSYLTFPVGSPWKQLPKNWSLHTSSHSELWELDQFYRHSSGGLLLNVLDLTRSNPTEDSLENVSRQLGFLRKWNAYSLTNGGCLKAVLVVNQSDVGLNLSELLNGIKTLIIDPEGLSWELLNLAASHLTDTYQLDNIPFLIYPSAYCNDMNIPQEKRYYLWITDMRHSGKFMEYMQRNFRMKYE
ncbi:MAG: hypothetical protein FJ139_02885 [Deltaproteobacteria bacterium]|nr:hypothetical protein [Deltaproteobacteria bacterium]